MIISKRKALQSLSPNSHNSTDIFTSKEAIKDTKKIKTLSQLYNQQYDKMASVFHRSSKVRMVGRTAERNVISSFFSSLNENNDNVLYICGNPGTGKTALVEEIISDLKMKDILTVLNINCLMINDSFDILNMISENIGMLKIPKNDRETPQIFIDSIYSYITFNSCNPLLLILDEIDQLVSKSSDLLKSIFSLAFNRKIFLVGIANSIDLAIRQFPNDLDRIKILKFHPYSSEDVSRILIARLDVVKECQDFDMINSMAFEFCSRKVSAVGDLRKALEIMKEAVNLANIDYLKGSGSIVQVGIVHITKSLNLLFSGMVNTASKNAEIIKELNLHQKILLAVLVRFLKQSEKLKPTVQSLFSSYEDSIHQNRILEPASKSEFNDLLSNMESMGILSIFTPKIPSSKKTSFQSSIPKNQISLLFSLEDSIKGLSDNPVIREILE